VLKENSRSTGAYAGLSRVYLKREKIEEALAAAQKAVELEPASSEAHDALGEVYYRQGKLKEAENEFLAVLGRDEKDARAYLGLARINHALSLYHRFKIAIDAAYKFDPADPDIQRVWTSTRLRAERIRALEAYLASGADDDAEARKATEQHLALLKAREQQPSRSCHLVTKTTSTQTEMEPLLMDIHHYRGYGLTVTVNGKKSRLLLDTGASGIVINRTLAEKAGIQELVKIELRGIGDKGPASGYAGYAASIKVGELEFRDCLVEVVEKRSVVGDEGLIGADVFEDFLVDLDFPNAKLKLTELPRAPGAAPQTASLQTGGTDTIEYRDAYVAPEMNSYTKILRFGHALLIPTKVSELPQKLFLMDTGAVGDLISPAAAREVTKVYADNQWRMKGLSGEVKNVLRTDELTLQFGHLRQKSQSLTSFDLSSISKSVGTEVSGILGFKTLILLEIKIDYRDGLIDLTYTQKR
jgi:predicted aspartyl protease